MNLSMGLHSSLPLLHWRQKIQAQRDLHFCSTSYFHNKPLWGFQFLAFHWNKLLCLESRLSTVRCSIVLSQGWTDPIALLVNQKIVTCPNPMIMIIHCAKPLAWNVSLGPFKYLCSGVRCWRKHLVPFRVFAKVASTPFVLSYVSFFSFLLFFFFFFLFFFLEEFSQ